MLHTWIMATELCDFDTYCEQSLQPNTHPAGLLAATKYTNVALQVKATEYFGTPLAEVLAARQCETILQHDTVRLIVE